MNSPYYNEVVANYTWYRLNSDFKDPMYQYMFKLYRNVTDTIQMSIPITSYRVSDDFIVNVKNVSLQYGSYECSAPGKTASMDSWFSCILFQIPFFLESLQTGYIGFVFLLPIMLISIFGGIKESYKWFILNQAIWDAFVCYDFICAKPTLIGWSNSIYLKENTCFYRDVVNDNSDYGTLLFHVKQGFRVFLRNASFIPVFHLAFSRFLAMYFPRFYKNFSNNGYKIFIFIALFNATCITIFSVAYATQIASVNSIIKDTTCDEFCPTPNNTLDCFQNFPKFFQCDNRRSLDVSIKYVAKQRIPTIFKYISYSIPPIMFFLSIICAGFLFRKIASQLKFQLKTNQESFKQTIKISSVVGFQCATMSIIFVITGIQKFMQIKALIFGTYFIYDDLPPWLLLLQYYTTTASLNMIRILLDSCIILTVLSGYSKCIVSSFQFLCQCLKNPKKAFKKIKSNITKTQVTMFSTSQN